MNKRYTNGLVIAVAFMVTVLFLRKVGVGSYLSLANVKEQSMHLKHLAEQNYFGAVMIYLALYTLIISFAIPAVGPLTLIGGFLFNTLPGLVYATIGATAGSLIYFLFVRYVLKSTVSARYATQLQTFKDRINEYGYNYLLTLQLVTVVPFFIINSLAALADVPILTFLWTTIVGCIPLLFVYALAGRQLATIESLGDIFTLPMLIVFLLLAVLAAMPMIIKRVRANVKL